MCTNFIFINQSIIMKYSDLISELEVRWHNASSLAIKYYFSSPIKPSITYILSYLCNMYNIYLQHMPLIYLGLWLRYLLISFFLLFREFPVHAHCSRIQSESQWHKSGLVKCQSSFIPAKKFKASNNNDFAIWYQFAINCTDSTSTTEL